MYRARTPDRHDTNNVCEALHMYLATRLEIMTYGDLDSQNTNRLPATQQPNWHLKSCSLHSATLRSCFCLLPKLKDQVRLHSQWWWRQAGMAERQHPSNIVAGMLFAMTSTWSYTHCSANVVLINMVFDYLHWPCELFLWYPAWLWT